jgi:hypothetical protein
MTNPIPSNGFIVTPESFDDLFERLQNMYPGKEQASAFMAAAMALNLAHKLFEDFKQPA